MSAAGNATTPGPQLLNPYTPMAWVSPRLARKMTIQLYIAVGSLSALLWDIVLHLPQDYKLLTKHRINSSFVVYCISRIATLAYVLGLVITQTAPVGNCGYIRDVSFIYTVALPSTLLLFVWRISALYSNHKFVVILFSFSWLCVLASAIAVAIGTSAFRVGKTDYCAEFKSKKSSAFAATIPLVHDSLIFVATSWAFMRYSYIDVGVNHRFKVMVLGKHLSALSKSILRDGQAYYLITLVINLVFVVVAFAMVSPCIFGNPTIVILNNMSCYVYRSIRFGFYRDNTVHTSAIRRALGTDDVEFGNQHDIKLGPTAIQLSGVIPDRGDPESAHADCGSGCHDTSVPDSKVRDV